VKITLGQVAATVGNWLAHPIWSLGRLLRSPDGHRAKRFVDQWKTEPAPAGPAPLPGKNPLREFFDRHTTGRGIWKWTPYFDAYHRHLQKFVGTDAHVVEVGIYSGGSLEMWVDYFGPRCRVTGIDIMPECKEYEGGQVRVLVGDQGSREFWSKSRKELPPIDVVIDDGGHTPELQRVTLEETLPHLRPGGVYLCEDIHGRDNRFSAYVQELASELNAKRASTPFQRDVLSIHLYPYLVVIERATQPAVIESLKNGTEWSPVSCREILAKQGR